MAYDYDLICIGSGPAGQRCAIQAAKLGKRAAAYKRRTGYCASSSVESVAIYRSPHLRRRGCVITRWTNPKVKVAVNASVRIGARVGI